MKKILLSLLVAVVVIGALVGAGFAGYRIGFNQGLRASLSEDALLFGRFDRIVPDEFLFDNFNRDFERGFNRGFPPGRFRMMHRGGFGFFGPFMFLGNILFWGLIILVVYWLFTRSGWRLTRTEQTVQQTSPNADTVTKVQEEETKNE